MSLLNDASLVFIPSGYKEDKVYSVIPSNGAGDLDFVRGCDATRVNPQSLVENTPWNLLSYSEDFTNVIWGKVSLNVSANTTTSPNGTLTADTISDIAANQAHSTYQSGNPIATGSMIGSVYLKDNGRRYAVVSLATGASAQIRYSAVVDLQNGTITQNNSLNSPTNTSSSITNIGNGWYRISVKLDCTIVASNANYIIVATSNTGTPTTFGSGTLDPQYVGNGSSIFIWGAQLESGSTAKPYFPTTDRLNVPRLTYSPTLIERQSTNICTYSEDFTAWSVVNSSVSANQVVSPDGTANADKITEDNTNGIHVVYAGPFSASAGTYTTSVYYKKGTRRYFSVKAQLGSSLSYTQVFDADNLVVGGYSSNGLTGVSASIENAGNGWVRAILTGTTSQTGFYIILGLSNSLNPTFDSINNNPTYAGSGTDYGYFWGAQLEAGTPATSYIPTTSTAVTRVASYNSGCPSLLLEKQSTNLYTYSEDLSQWNINLITRTSNYAISPDGTQNADRVQFSSTASLIWQNGTGSAGTNTLSVWAKATSGTAQKFRFFANGATTFSSDFIATDQWQRFEFSYTFTAVTAGLSAPSTGASDVLFWGMQHEVSSYPTSYIPTTSTTVTRLADSCSKTGISSLIGQTSGTIFIDVNLTHSNGSGGNEYLIQLYQDASNRVLIYRDSTNKLSFYVLVGGGNYNFQSSVTSNGRHKIGFAYQSGNSAFYIDGTQIVLDTTTFSSFSSMSALHLGANYNPTIAEIADYEYNQTLLFKRRLTNTELANLTTL